MPQAVPGVPQLVGLNSSQLLPLQHPLGQEVASQRHTPPATQCSPGAQEPPSPHLHRPKVH
jgi:hypothetical protein